MITREILATNLANQMIVLMGGLANMQVTLRLLQREQRAAGYPE